MFDESPQFLDVCPGKVKPDARGFIDLLDRSGISELEGADIALHRQFGVFPVGLPDRDGAQLGHSVFDVVEGYFENMELLMPYIFGVVFKARPVDLI